LAVHRHDPYVGWEQGRAVPAANIAPGYAGEEGWQRVSETFRPARPEEVEEVARLGMHSFPAPNRTLQWWLEYLTSGPHGGLEALWVAEEGGRLVGACQLHWLRQWIAGQALPVMGLGSVAIAPTHRRRGLAARMLIAGFAHARERGDVGSALYPFRASFYEELGYGLAGEAHQYQLPPALLPDAPEERLRVRLVDGPETEADMRAVYAEAACRAMTGQLDRTERSWRKAWGEQDQAAVVYYGEGGKPEGYAIVRYRSDLPVTTRYLEVEERMWMTLGAQRGLYGWLSTMSDQWRELVYRAHPEEGFGDLISEPRLPLLANPSWGLWFPSATLMRGPMFRVLDVPAALSSRTLLNEASFTLRLEVDDQQIPENRGPWVVRFEGNAMFVEPDAGGAADATLRIPMDTLSRVFIGALAMRQAISGGLAWLDRPELARPLDQAFAVPRPWTFDKF
jgi:predicted acetyltransferase